MANDSNQSVSVVRLSESEKVTFAENSHYQPILKGEAGGFPIYTGIQTAEAGHAIRQWSHVRRNNFV